MSQNTGTLVIAPIRPSSSLDQFATAYANEIKGGFHAVEDIIERNAISPDRRIEGMLTYVVDETKIYQLQGGITNADWIEFGGDFVPYTGATADVDLGDFSLTADSLNSATSGYERDEWVAQSYVVDDEVRHNGNDYICIANADPEDEPGIATTKWEEEGPETLNASIIGFGNATDPEGKIGANLYNPTDNTFIWAAVENGNFDNLILDTGYLFIGNGEFTGNLAVAGNLGVTGNVTGGNLNTANWDTAFGWGNHALAGYLTEHQSLAGLVPYTGATADVDLGSFNLDAGTGLFTGNLSVDGSFYLETAEMVYEDTWLKINNKTDVDGELTANDFIIKDGGKLYMDNVSLAYGVKDSFGFYSSFYFGRGSGNSSTTGDSNTGVGAETLTNITTGDWNVAVGAWGLKELTTGDSNVAISQSLISLVSGESNIGIGRGSLISVINALRNTAIGFGALANTNTNDNLGIGVNAGNLNQGYNNLFIGNEADVLVGSETINNSVAIGKDVKVGGSFSSIIGGQGNILTGDYSDSLGGIMNQNKGEFSAIIGGSYNEIGTEGEYSNIVSSLQCYTNDFGSWVSGSLGCSATDSSVILNSIMTETKGTGALAIASYTGFIEGYGSSLFQSTGCYIVGIGNSIVGGLYSNISGAARSSIFNSDYTYITDMFSMAINGQENTISKPFSFAFGNVINVMATNSVGFNLDLLPIEICQDNTMAIMNGKLGIGLCDPSETLEIKGSWKAQTGEGSILKTDLKTFDLNLVAPGLAVNMPIISGETTNTYETALLNYATVFRGNVASMANDRIKFGQYPETVANTGTGTDWTSLDNVKTKDANPTMWTSDDITVDSYEITNVSFPVGADYKKVGQTFNSAEPNIISKVELNLSNTTTATGNAVVKIYEIFDAYGLTSIPYGDVLATSDAVDVSTIGTTSEWVEFEFTNRIRLGGNNHKYALVLEYDGGASYLLWSRDTETLTHSGNGFAEIDEEWVGNPDWDFTFRVEGSPNITIEKIQLVKNGTPVGDDKAQGLSMPLSAESLTWGDEDDLWGTTWTSTDFATLSADVEVKTSANTSKTLRLTFADLELPAVDVKGIKVEIYGNQLAGNALLFYAVATAYVGVKENPGFIFTNTEITDGVAQIIFNLDTENLETDANFCPDSELYGDAEYLDLGQDGLEWNNLYLRGDAHIGDGKFSYDNDRMYVTNVATARSIDRTSDVAVATETVTNTTTETTIFTGELTGNSIRIGNILKLFMGGNITTASTSDTATIRVKVRGNTFATIVSPGKNLIDDCWRIDGIATIRTIGESGSMAWIIHMEVEDEMTDECSVDTIDTTESNDITVTAQWNNAKTGNVLNLTQGFLEYKN